MRTLMLSLLAAASAFSAPAPSFPAQTPRKSPEFAVQMPGGGQTLVSSYRGKVVVLAFLYTT
ncbi:MAG: hypothetical protein M3Z36_03735 [Acidobacteriota bacterium]|nr:hypothetical protein [Acidobacteriota bacterium]